MQRFYLKTELRWKYNIDDKIGKNSTENFLRILLSLNVNRVVLIFFKPKHINVHYPQKLLAQSSAYTKKTKGKFNIRTSNQGFFSFYSILFFELTVKGDFGEKNFE